MNTSIKIISNKLTLIKDDEDVLAVGEGDNLFLAFNNLLANFQKACDEKDGYFKNKIDEKTKRSGFLTINDFVQKKFEYFATKVTDWADKTSTGGMKISIEDHEGSEIRLVGIENNMKITLLTAKGSNKNDSLVKLHAKYNLERYGEITPLRDFSLEDYLAAEYAYMRNRFTKLYGNFVEEKAVVLTGDTAPTGDSFPGSHREVTHTY